MTAPVRQVPVRRPVRRLRGLPGGGGLARPCGASVLVVEDEPSVARFLAATLTAGGYRAATAGDAAAAREALAARAFELVVCDLGLPDAPGAAVVREIAARRPATAVVVVSGSADPGAAAEVTELGAYGYLVKPFGVDQFLITVANALRRRELEQERLRHERELEHAVAVRTAELRLSREQTVRRLAAAIDSRDDVTGIHGERTAALARAIGEQAGMTASACDLLAMAAPLHDIGKLAVRDSVLRKPGPLDPVERAQMEAHTTIGRRMLAGSGEELLELAATVAWTHHERLDGSGYPRGLAGREIPEAGRVVAVADVFDALTSDRPYRPAFGADEAVDLILSLRGSRLDGDFVDALLDTLE